MGFQSTKFTTKSFHITIGMLIIISIAMADFNSDKQECAEQLVGLATCLPYVGGTAKAPTPDCCNGLKEVLKKNKKCLCVIIKDRNDPDLGLTINVTLALGLPSVCHAPADVSKCPALLNLPPNSPDAQVFYQFANRTNHHIATSPAPSPGVNSEGPSPSSMAPIAQQKSSAWSIEKRGIIGVEIISFAVSILYFANKIM